MSIAVAGSTAGAYDLQYFTTDHLGSVRVVTGGSGNVVFSSGYMPYGTGTNTAGSAMNEFRFSGKEVQPQAGLLDFGARLYDPRSASWLSPDPKSEKYYSVSPYAYCANDTLDLVDPEGEVPHVVIGDSSSAVSKSIRKEVASEFRDAGKKISYQEILTAILIMTTKKAHCFTMNRKLRKRLPSNRNYMIISLTEASRTTFPDYYLLFIEDANHQSLSK